MAGTVDTLRKAFESQGVQFIDDGAYQGDGGPGVRLRKGMTSAFGGQRS
ncbi:hypothetical protein M2352_000337 [Azospirillum fermentarium]|nr:hypothetical protein [Azospirillum fermentarium]